MLLGKYNNNGDLDGKPYYKHLKNKKYLQWIGGPDGGYEAKHVWQVSTSIEVQLSH